MGGDRGGEAALEGEGGGRNMRCKTKRYRINERKFVQDMRLNLIKWGRLAPLLKC